MKKKCRKILRQENGIQNLPAAKFSCFQFQFAFSCLKSSCLGFPIQFQPKTNLTKSHSTPKLKSIMDQHERPRPENQPSQSPGSAGGPTGANLNAIRQQAAGMLQFSESMLVSALSMDSQSFNQSVKQPPAQ
ncbi:MAG: hypothetical protein C5B50_02205 [Verrucomicrobia bacterium]|nr:MAG: hypothetical protein C5B50_02205 [Verrucomicrobiota bacterium]